MALTDVHFVARSGNTKTGPIPVTYRPESTCPTTCPFLPSGTIGGCYGTGRLFALADQHTADVTETDTVAKLRDATPIGARYLRDRVVGDVVTPDGSFDLGYVESVANVARQVGITAFGYTHAWRTMTPAMVDTIARSGYVMNASCETETDVHDATELGLPVVITGDQWQDGTMIGNRRIVTCPAETRRGTTCNTCGLCAKPDRAAIVRFHVHGQARARATRAINARNEQEATN